MTAFLGALAGALLPHAWRWLCRALWGHRWHPPLDAIAIWKASDHG